MAMAEYEPIQPYYLIELATRASCATFLDVGANIGAYSVFASRIPTVHRMIAFEANAKAASEIIANARLNGLNIEVHQMAVSDRAGELEFGVVSDFAGNNAVVSSALHDDFRRTVKVKAIALDDIPALDGPVCLKIDVEGHEAEVIDGATKLLISHECVVQMEGYQDEAGKKLEAMGYARLTKIGPDVYYSNIAGLSALGVYEDAMEAIISSHHRNKAVTLKRGDVALTLTGRTAELARKTAKKVLGRRL
jgi:FkbM family methyltransferase